MGGGDVVPGGRLGVRRQFGAYAVVIGGDRVRLDDLSVGFWGALSKDESDDWSRLLIAPMSRPDLAIGIAVEAARLLKLSDPAKVIDDLISSPYGEPSLSKLADLFQSVEDDLPDQMTTPDGGSIAVPPSGDETSISG